MKIVIVGGGTSGWWCAGHLIQKNPSLDITVIESPVINKIGVGESVLPQTRQFFDRLGIDESKWMKHCEAVHKLGNMKQGWHRKDDKPFLFSFWWNYDERMLGRSLEYRGDTKLLAGQKKSARLGDYWIDMYQRGLKTRDDFVPDTCSSWGLVQNKRSPYYPDGTPALGEFAPYAYHINAEKASDVVRDQIGLPLGVKHVHATVTDVEFNGTEVTSIKLDNGDTVTADLFVDCTGFRRTLIGKFDPKIKYYDRIKCNSAVVAPFAYNNKDEELEPYTQTLAKDCGWQFIITLDSRIGSGYVFDRNQLDPEEAKKQLLSWWPNHTPIKEPRLITWDPSRLEKSWHGNVVAIGLSNFFIEPLEANGVYGIEYGVEILEMVLKKHNYQVNDHVRTAYSRTVGQLLDHTAQFISHHYMLTDREDTPFWKFYKDLGKEINAEQNVWNYYMDFSNPLQHMYPDSIWLSMAIYFEKFKTQKIEGLKSYMFEHVNNHISFFKEHARIIGEQCKKVGK